jgi:hypothetical protein
MDVQQIPDIIKWHVGDRFDDAGDGHVTFHYADGESEDGRAWIGTAVKCDDELSEVTDIEPA